MTDLLTPPAAPTPASANLAGARVQVPPSLGAMLQELPALLQSTDPLAPSQAAQLLHQTARALDVVQQPGLARLLRAMETALRQPVAPTGTAPGSPLPRDVLLLAAKDAQAHLQTLQAGRNAQVAHLFPAYRAVCKLGGKDSAHPADLWELLWQLAPVPAPLPAALQVPPHRVAPSTRALLDQQVLAVVKNADAPAAARLRDLCLGLAQTCAAPADTAFWQAAAGCFDATAHGLLEQDLYTKRLASRVLMHYASVAKAGDSAFTPPPDTLVRDLLYYCAQAADTAAMVMDGLPPVLQAICHSCQLLPADAPARVAQAVTPTGDTTLTLDLGRGAEALAIPTTVAAPLHDPLAEPRSTTPAAGPSATSDDAGLNLSHLVFGDEPEAPEVPVEVAEPSAPPAARAPIPQPVAQTTGDLSIATPASAATSAAHDAALPATAGVVEAMDTSAVPHSATALDNTATPAAAASSVVPHAAGPSEIASVAAVSAANTPAAAEPLTEPVLLAEAITPHPASMPEGVVDATLAEQEHATSAAPADSVGSTTTAEAASGEHSAPDTDTDTDTDTDPPPVEAAQERSESVTDSAQAERPADDGNTAFPTELATTADTADAVSTSADVPPPQDAAAQAAAPMDDRTALATRLAAAAVPELQPGAALLQGAAGQPRAEPNQGFLTEADGLSQQLQTEITAWAAESDTPLPPTAAEQARALTRSAWGAGCTEISLLTHTLQMVLERLRRNATAAQRQACVHAADEVLRLLHQFAAGFMRRPHPQVLEALNHILADTVSTPPAPDSETRPAQDETDADGAAPDRHTTFIDGTATHQAIGHEEVPAAVPVPASVLPSVDQLEPVRFAVFEEEVLAVWPALQTALHQWMERPAEQGTPRQTLLRSLHTLKGSARLAGAAAWASQVHALEDLALLAQPNDGPLGPSALQQPLEVLRIAFVALQQELAARHPERSLQHWGASPIDTVGRHAQALWGTHEQTQQSVADNHQMLAEMESCLQRLRAQLKDCAAWADTLVLHGDMDLSYEWHEELHDLIRGLSDGVDDIGTVQRQLQHGLATADTALTTQAGHLRALQHTLLYARLTPLAQLHERLLATVQLAASDTGKPTQLLLEGGDQLLERSVADQLAPALEHLLRNCVDHGIEPAARRQAAGKPATGQISVRLHTQGPVQTLTVQDDGAGLQVGRVQTKALALGLLQPGETVDARRAAELILHPGLSTAAQITELSGRGIGMDAVQAGVQQLGGQLHIDSQPGLGCTFTITLPAPPQVEQVVALRAGSWSIALPARSIEAVRHIPAAQMDEAVAQGMLPDDVTGPMPLYWAGAVWQQSARSSAPPVDGQSIALVVRSDTSRWALQVDEVLGTQEVALQPPADVAVPLPGLLGTAAQPSGQVLQVYDPYAALAAHEARRLLQSAQPVAASDNASAPEVPPPLVLIADDSMSVRRLAQHLLQTQGYRVATAADGLLAWQLLEDGELPALLLADIEMPEMDGLELLRRVRADARCKQLPVVMLTAHEAGPVSQKAIDAGAQAFLTKPYAPNELLALVRRCARVPESDLQP